MRIPFNRPFTTGQEFHYIHQACMDGHISGDGPFTKKCHAWLEEYVGTHRALLTTSGTTALEMAALLADIGPGDEIIMPSYTFVSTANAFVLRGAIPVFIDVREDTMNLDERLIEAAITERTRAIVPVHYAGVGCNMNRILEIAEKHKLLVIEDAAQGICARYEGKPLGSLGHLGALSFHETKNLICGEGGALLVNDPSLVDRAEVLWQKGTNRKKFLDGQVDKYTWVDLGSSFLPSDIIAAFLLAQFEESNTITDGHLRVWNRYHAGLEALEQQGTCIRPVVPEGCDHNAHLYYIVIDVKERSRVINGLRNRDINAVFHYVPLHSSPAGVKFGRMGSDMEVTDRLSAGIIRLPIWVGMTEQEQDYVIQAIHEEIGSGRGRILKAQ